jgi:hypothetical protein
VNLAFGCACVVRGRGALTLLIQDLPSSLYLNESIRHYTHITHTHKSKRETHNLEKNIGAAREHKKSDPKICRNNDSTQKRIIIIISMLEL